MLFRKCRTLLLMVLAVPVVLLVRLLQLLVVIRFGPLCSNRIGHLAADTEVYLCERDAGIHGRRTFDIFYHITPICNHQLKKMWERILCIFRFAKYLDRVNRLIPGSKKHTIGMRLNTHRDIHTLLNRTSPHLSFTTEEERFGQNELRKLGIPNGKAFVCFHGRDSAFLDTTLANRDWNYHNYRDCNIHNYILAAEELVRRGYFTIRMGAIVKEPLQTRNPMIIDYAVNGRTDFLDVYLGAKCQFFFCDTAGIFAIPTIFRRPIAWVNYIPLERAPTWAASHLFIPKKLWLRKDHRFLTFREILGSEIGRFLHSEKYEQLGIEVIENTPEEITDVVVEMDERLKGRWQTTEEDEQLQQRFWALFKPSKLNQVFLSRIGAKFLRQNRELLEIR